MSAGARASSELIEKAMRSTQTRVGILRRAAAVRQTAESIAAAEDVKLNSTMSEGTRPKGRPFARVASPNGAQEWGNATTERRRVLGRAAEANR